MPPVLVCRTAWMNEYRGIHGDMPVGGGAYVQEQGFGHEVFNFLAEGGRFFGYVRPPNQGPVANQRINIDRLGAASSDEYIDGVTVVWVATDPEQGGVRVVGWYEDARVHRAWRPTGSPQRILPNGDDAGFMIETTRATLLGRDDRQFVVPRATELETGIGQANVWYPQAEWAARLLNHIASIRDGVATPAPKGPAHLVDTEKRLRIEKAAMAATAAWCEARSFDWRDVSMQKVGWDIEAVKGKTLLRIEVKGTSLAIGAALLELTPNEYAKMRDAAVRPSFRLSVVSVAEDGAVTVRMFAWSPETNRWIADGGALVARLHEVVSARIEIVSGEA